MSGPLAPWIYILALSASPGIVITSRLDNRLVSSVQMAPCPAQSVVTGIAMVTPAFDDDRSVKEAARLVAQCLLLPLVSLPLP